jgi:hypothetical protein
VAKVTARAARMATLPVVSQILRDIRGFLWLTQAKSVEKRGKEKSF